MIVALYLGNMKMILLLSLISIICSCVHKNADKEVWKDLQEKMLCGMGRLVCCRSDFSFVYRSAFCGNQDALRVRFRRLRHPNSKGRHRTG